MRGRSKSCAVDKHVTLETHDSESSKLSEAIGGMDDGPLRTSMFADTMVEHVPTLRTAKPDIDHVEDDEERDLRLQLEALEGDKRKARLRAALACHFDASRRGSSSGDRAHSSRRRGKSHRRKRAMASCSTSTSSDSSTTSSSDTSRSHSRRQSRRKSKKRHSKFSLHGYTKGKKSVKKLSFPELMYASLLWGIKRSRKVGMSYADLIDYMGHLCYLSMHATSSTFNDEAFRGYDHAIREKAKEKGVRAFKMGDSNISLLHFNLENSRSLRDSRRSYNSSKATREMSKPKRGVCYGFNFNNQGCTRKECSWDHRCLSCKSKDHPVSSCPTKKN